MNAGAIFALLPALLALVFRFLAGALGADWQGISDPLSALLRSLPALALFWGWRAEEFKRPAILSLYGAYAGAVLDQGAVRGAVAGFLLGLLLLPFFRVPRPHRFWAALAYVVLATALFTAALVWLGVPSGWLLPLILLLFALLNPDLPRLRED